MITSIRNAPGLATAMGEDRGPSMGGALCQTWNAIGQVICTESVYIELVFDFDGLESGR
ncbi:hypothetical protein [Comamonas sp.]|uniref:hypothetical protein n=1 Tax=Comamonas sp. TaxID=34028 RepID=UPI003021C445